MYSCRPHFENHYHMLIQWYLHQLLTALQLSKMYEDWSHSQTGTTLCCGLRMKLWFVQLFNADLSLSAVKTSFKCFLNLFLCAGNSEWCPHSIWGQWCWPRPPHCSGDHVGEYLGSVHRWKLGKKQGLENTASIVTLRFAKLQLIHWMSNSLAVLGYLASLEINMCLLVWGKIDR